MPDLHMYIGALTSNQASEAFQSNKYLEQGWVGHSRSIIAVSVLDGERAGLQSRGGSGRESATDGHPVRWLWTSCPKIQAAVRVRMGEKKYYNRF